MLNIILAVFMYPILFIIYIVQKSEEISDCRTLFGIRYSEEWLSDTEKKQYETEYHRSVKRSLIILALLPAITFFIPWFSILVSFWMLWTIAVIVFSQLFYFKANRKLLALKKERVSQTQMDSIVYAELKNAGTIRCVKWQQFAAPVGISILLAVFSMIYFSKTNFEVLGITIMIFAGCTLLFYLCAVCMDKMKTQVISDNSDVNVNYSRAKKKMYKNLWLQSAWLNTGFTAALVIFTLFNIALSFYIILWGVILYCLVEFLLCVRIFSKQKTITRQYEKQINMQYDNEEENWIGGMFYYNPKDKNTMVSKRIGMGTTVNMATPGGKAFMGFTALVFLSFPIICIWIILLEFMPISLSVQNDTLIARHLKNDYVIDIDSITELTLEEELPRSSKVAGTSMDNLKKGTFRNSTEEKRFQMFLNPQNEYYLRFVADDTIYYISGYDDEETLEIYDLLTH